MKSVYGESDIHYPGVTVEYDATTNLMKLVTEGDVKIEILSDGGLVFVKPEEIKTAIATTTVQGFSSTVPSVLDGESLSGDVVIDEWNEHLEFTYRDAGVDRNISIDVPKTTYSYNATTGTYDTLQTAIQQQLDTQAGTGEFVVDDVEYDITLNPAFYPTDSLIDTLNKKLEEAGAPLVAELDDGRVKISHTKLGEHSIQEISGSAKDEVFLAAVRISLSML